MIHTEKGFSVLFIVLLVLAMSVPFTLGAVTLSVGSTQTGLSTYNGTVALLLAESCTEDILLHLRNDWTYEVSELTLPSGSCTVEMSRQNDAETVQVTATKGEYSHRVEVVVTGNESGLEFQSWNETSL